MTAPSWQAVALQPEVVRRSIGLSLVVGTILVLVNHVDKIVTLDIRGADVLKMALTYLVPYCVSTYSSVMTTLEEHQRPKRR